MTPFKQNSLRSFFSWAGNNDCHSARWGREFETTADPQQKIGATSAMALTGKKLRPTLSAKAFDELESTIRPNLEIGPIKRAVAAHFRRA